MKILLKRTLLLSLLVLVVMSLTVLGTSAETVITVGTEDDLASAIANAASGDTIQLSGDHEITAVIEINKDLTLDLGGNTLTATAGAFHVTAGTVTVKNGTLNAQNDAFIMGVKGATDDETVVLNLADNLSVTSATDCAVVVYAGTLNTEADLTVNGSYAAIQGSGNPGNDGTVINVIGGNVTSTGDIAIYQPQNGVLSISGGTVTGATGVYVKNGTANIIGGEIKATGLDQEYTVEGNGAPNTGDALVVENSTYATNLSVSVTGGTFTAANGHAVVSYADTANSYETVTGFVAGGSFDEVISTDLCAFGFTPATQADENGNYSLTLTDEVVASVGTTNYATLAEAINAAAAGDTVVLAKDATVDAVITIDKDLVLDLGGKTLSGANFKILSGTVTVQNGSINAAGDIFVMGTKGEENDPTIVLNLAATLTVNSTTDCAVVVYAGTLNTEAVLSTESTSYCVIQGSGNPGNGGTVINVTGGSVTSAATIAIYQPQDGVLNISGGTISGSTGVYVKNGAVNVTGGSISATGAAGDYTFNNNGATDTGDALVIDNCSYSTNLTVSVSGGTFSSVNGDAVASYADTDYTAVTGFVTGGAFDERISDDLCADGYVLSVDADGNYGAAQGEYVVEVNGLGYTTIDEALANAAEGATITFLADVELTEALRIRQTVTFDLDGHKLTLAALDNYGLVIYGDLTITGNGYVHANGAYGIGLSTSCTGGLTVENGTFTADDSNVYLIGAFNGTVTIKDGSFTSPYCVLNSFDGYEAEVVVTGGTFDITDTSDETAAPLLGINVAVSGGTYYDAIDQSYCVDGFILTYNAETGAYSVAEGEYVAKIGEVGYDTLANAVLLAKAGDTITLLDNLTLDATLVVDKDLTIDGAGFALTSTAASAFKVSATLAINCEVVADLLLDATGACTVTTTVESVATALNAQGYALTKSGDVWTVVSNAPEAAINGWNYDTVENAIANATAGQTVTLLTDATVEAVIEISKNLTIDGDNHTLNSTAGSKAKGIYVTAGITLTVTDLKFNHTGNGDAIFMGAGATLTLNGATKVTTNQHAIVLWDRGVNDANIVTINIYDNVEITTPKQAILISGSGSSTGSAATVTIGGSAVLTSTASHTIQLAASGSKATITVKDSAQIISTADAANSNITAIYATGSSAMQVFVVGAPTIEGPANRGAVYFTWQAAPNSSFDFSGYTGSALFISREGSDNSTNSFRFTSDLNEAITHHNPQLGNGSLKTVYFLTDATVALTETITVGAPTRLVGNGATVTSSAAVAFTLNADLTVENLTLGATAGKLIDITGTDVDLTISNSTLTATDNVINRAHIANVAHTGNVTIANTSLSSSGGWAMSLHHSEQSALLLTTTVSMTNVTVTGKYGLGLGGTVAGSAISFTGGSISVTEEAFYLRARSSATFTNTTLSASGSRLGYVCNYSSLTFDGVTATYTGTSNAIYCANGSHPTVLFKNQSSLTAANGMGIKMGDSTTVYDYSLTLQDSSSITAGKEAILVNSGASTYTVNILSGSTVKSTAGNAIKLNGTFKNFALNITNSTVISTADSTYAIEVTGSGTIPITIDGGTVKVEGKDAIAIHQKSSTELIFTVTMKGNALISATASGSRGMYLEDYKAVFSFYQYGGKIVSASHAIQLKVANGASHNNLLLIKPTAGLDDVPEIETTSNNAVFYIHGNSNIEFDLEGAYLKGANAIINKTNPGNETPRTLKMTMKTSKMEAGSAYAVYVADASDAQSYFKVDFTISDSTITSSGNGGIIADGDEGSTIKIYRTTITTSGRSLRFREYMDLYLEDCIVTSTNGDAVVWEQNNDTLGGMFKVTALRTTIASENGRAVVAASAKKGSAPELSFTSCVLSATGHTINISDKLASLSIVNSTVTTTASGDSGNAAIRLDIDAGQTTAITIKNDSIAKDKDGNLVPSIKSASRGISLHRGNVYTLTLENVYIDAAYTAVHRSNYGGSYAFNATFTNCIFVSSVNPVFTLAKESVDGAPSAILNVAFNNCQITSKAASEGYAAIRMGGTEGSKVTLNGSTVLTPGIAFHVLGDVELNLTSTTVGTEESPVEIGIKAIRIGNIKVNVLNSSIYSASHSVYVHENYACSMELNLTQATITANTATAIYSNPGAGAATFTGTWFDSTVTGKNGSAVSLGYNKNQLTITLNIYDCTLIATQTANGDGYSALRLRGKNGSEISIVDSELKIAESSKDFTVGQWALLDLSTPNLNDVMTVNLTGTTLIAYKGNAIRQREDTSNTVLTLTGCDLSANGTILWSSNGHIALTVEDCDFNGGTAIDIGGKKDNNGNYSTVTSVNSDFVTTGTAFGLHTYVIATVTGGTIDADGKGFDTNNGDVTLTVDGLTKFETGGRSFEVGYERSDDALEATETVDTYFKLVLKNVDIVAGGDGMYVMGWTNIDVTMEKVTMDTGWAGIYANTTDSRVTIVHAKLDLKDITITAGSQGIFVDSDSKDLTDTYAKVENITITVVAGNNDSTAVGGVGLEIDQMLSLEIKGKINIDTTGANADQQGLVFWCGSSEGQHTIEMTEGLIVAGGIAVHPVSSGKIYFTMTGGRIVSNNSYAFKFELDNEREINLIFDELNEETPDIWAKNGRAFSIHGHSDTIFNIKNANIKAENENAIHATDPSWDTPCALTLSVENSLITSTTGAGLFVGRNADITLTDTGIYSKSKAIDKGASSVCNIFKLTATDCTITSTNSYGINAAQNDGAVSNLQMTIVLTRTNITAQHCLVIDAKNAGDFKSTLTMTGGLLTATDSCLWNKEDLVAVFDGVTMQTTKGSGTAYGINAPMNEIGGSFELTLDDCSVTVTNTNGVAYGLYSNNSSTTNGIHHDFTFKGTTSFNVTAQGTTKTGFGMRLYSACSSSSFKVTILDEVEMHVSSTDKSSHNSVINLDGPVLMTLTINLTNAYGEEPNFTHDSGYGIHMQTGARRPTISITNAYFDVYRLAIYSADGGSTSTITIKDSKFVAETNKGVYLGENKSNTVYLTMENCYVEGASQGLEVGAKGYVTIKNCTFIADTQALDLRGQNSTGDVYSTVYNCTITGDNKSLYLADCKNVIIEKCTITAEDPKTDWAYNNHAIYVWSYVDATLKDCTVTMDGDFACAIYYCDSCTDSTLTLDNTNVTSGLDGAYINQTINCKLVMKNGSTITATADTSDRGIVLLMNDKGDSFTLEMDNSSITSKMACISFNDGKDVTDIGTLTVIMKNGSSLTNQEEGDLTGIANSDARDYMKRHGYGIFIWDKINLNLTVENSTITSAGVAGVYLHRHGTWDVDIKNSTITCTGTWGVAVKLFSANNASVDLDFHNTTLTGVRSAFEADGHSNDVTRYYSFTYDKLSETANISATSNAIWLRGAGHLEIEFKNAYVAATNASAVYRTDGAGAIYTFKAEGSKFTSPTNAAINIAYGVGINAVTKLSLTDCTVIGKTQGLIVAGKVGGDSTLYVKGGYYADTAGVEGRSVGSGSIQVSGDITITLEGATIHSFNDCAIRQCDSISTTKWTITDCIITSDGEYGFYSSNGNCDLTLNGTTSIELSDTDAVTRGIVFSGSAYTQKLTIADTVSIIVHGNGNSHAVHSSSGKLELTMTGGYLESFGHAIRLQCSQPGNFIHILMDELDEENPDIVSHNDSAIYIHNQHTYDVKIENAYLKGADYAFGKTNPGGTQITRLDMLVKNSKLEGGNWTLFCGWGDSQIMDVHASFYNTEFICGSGLALDGIAGSEYYFEGCTITAGEKALFLSDELKLTMKDCTINSTAWGIFNHEAPINGSTLDISIEDCEFSAELSAIYIRRTDVVDLTLTVKDSTLHSNTGFAVTIGANTNDANAMTNGSNNMVDVLIENCQISGVRGVGLAGAKGSVAVLNGNTITAGRDVIYVTTDIAVTINGGTINATLFADWTPAIYAKGTDSSLTMNGVTLNAAAWGVYLADGSSPDLYLNNCVINAVGAGVRANGVYGITVEIKDCEINVSRMTDGETNYGGTAVNFGYLKGAMNLTVENCVINCADGNGVTVIAPSTAAVRTNVKVTNCTITTGGNGLTIGGGTWHNTEVRNNTVVSGSYALELNGLANSNVIISGGSYESTAYDAVINGRESVVIDIYSGYFLGHKLSTARVTGDAVMNIYGGYFCYTGTLNPKDTEDHGNVLRNGTWSEIKSCQINVFGGTFVNQADSSVFYSIHGNPVNLYSFNAMGGNNIYTDSNGEFTPYPNDACIYALNNPVMINGAQVRLVLSENQAGGIRFTTTISAETLGYIERFADTDAELVIGTVIVPLDYLENVPAFTLDALEAAGLNYLNIVAQNGLRVNRDGSVTVRAAITEIKEQNYDRAFAAIAYVKSTVNGEDVYYYSNFDAEENARSLKQLANSALSDTSAAQNSTYRFEVLDENGAVVAYSRYTDEQQAVLNRFNNCTYTETIVKEPTATEPGLKEVTCPSCGTHYEELIPPTGEEALLPDEAA